QPGRFRSDHATGGVAFRYLGLRPEAARRRVDARSATCGKDPDTDEIGVGDKNLLELALVAPKGPPRCLMIRRSEIVASIRKRSKPDGAVFGAGAFFGRSGLAVMLIGCIHRLSPRRLLERLVIRRRAHDAALRSSCLSHA